MATMTLRDELAAQIWRVCTILSRDEACCTVMDYVAHMSWLLFLRFLDDQQTLEERQAIREGRAPVPILDDPFRWRSWARRTWDGDALRAFILNSLLPALQQISGSPMRDAIRSIFTEHRIVVASGETLKDAAAAIDAIDVTNRDDLFALGRAYEEMLRRMGADSRQAGEFYTPRPIVRFVVHVVAPQPGETVYDPAAGVGGFLIEAFAFINARRSQRTPESDAFLQSSAFVGNEKKPSVALLGAMNLVLHGIVAPGIRHRNTLEEDADACSERFDVILANPPFGGTENVRVQAHFTVPSAATELLFLQHVMRKLKPHSGARCGMVVPDGLLFRGGAFAKVRQELLEEFNVHTVVSLPQGAFSPYSDVKTSLLFFERPGPTRETWRYELPAPGRHQNMPRGDALTDDHFAEARDLWRAWDAYRHGRAPRPEPTARSWITPAETIAAHGYDLSIRSPHRPSHRQTQSAAEMTARLLESVIAAHATAQRLHAAASRLADAIDAFNPQDDDEQKSCGNGAPEGRKTTPAQDDADAASPAQAASRATSQRMRRRR